ncbi:MAG: hypothetical protein Fur007_23570 [Rhodoferax sp.]
MTPGAAPQALRHTPRALGPDALRGLAVLSVLALHLHEYVRQLWPGQSAFGASEAVARWLSQGWVGVDLFFVLSGYFIGSAVLRPAQWDPLRFVQNRVRRIVPAYYVSMLLVLVLLEQHFLANAHGWSHIGLHALFLHGLQPWSFFSINGPYWSLSLEFGFYGLMLALAPLLRTRALWPLLAAAVLVAWVWRAGVWLQVEPAQRFFTALQLPGTLDEFAAGIAVAAWQLRWPNRATTPHWVTGLVLAAGSVLVLSVLNFYTNPRVSYWTNGPAVVFSRTLLTLGFALWLAALVALRASTPLNTLIRISGLAHLGRISFSVYLYHVPVILATHRWGGAWLQPGPLWLAITIGATLTCATLSFRWVEQRWHPDL